MAKEELSNALIAAKALMAFLSQWIAFFSFTHSEFVRPSNALFRAIIQAVDVPSAALRQADAFRRRRIILCVANRRSRVFQRAKLRSYAPFVLHPAFS